jgi:hypothetical protein
MDIELTRGCVYGHLTIDDKLEIEMTDEQRREIKKKICEWILNEETSLNTLLRALIDHYHDSYECDSEPCECCGDYVETYKWKL